MQDTTLMCPHCEGEFLHQFRAEIIERRENADDGLRVSVDGVDQLDRPHPKANAHIGTNVVGAPGRRQSTIVHLWCESCHGRSALYIVQNKGQTDMRLVRA